MAIGPKRVPGRCEVPPSNGAPTMTTSAAARAAGSSSDTRSTPRNVTSGPYCGAVAAHSVPEPDSGVGTVLAVEPDPAHRQQDGDQAADDDAGIGQVEDGPVVQVDPVDDVAAQRARGPKEPVAEVAERAAEQQPERPGPAGRRQPAGRRAR